MTPRSFMSILLNNNFFVVAQFILLVYDYDVEVACGSLVLSISVTFYHVIF